MHAVKWSKRRPHASRPSRSSQPKLAYAYLSCISSPWTARYNLVRICLACSPEDRMKMILKLLPWFFLAFERRCCCLYAKNDGELHVREFARLPVLMNAACNHSTRGRIAVANPFHRRCSVEEVPSWKFCTILKSSNPASAPEVLSPELADTRPIFLIHHPDLLANLIYVKGSRNQVCVLYLRQLKSVWPKSKSKVTRRAS